MRVPLRDVFLKRTPGGEIQLFMTGEFFDEEFPAQKLGAGWRALCPRAGGFALVPTDVTIALVDAPVPSLNEGGHDWVARAPSCPGEGIFLVEGVALGAGRRPEEPPSLDAGAMDAARASAASDAAVADGVPVTTIAAAPEKLLEDGAATLAFGGRSYRLWVSGEPGVGARARGDEQSLVLESGAISEVLLDDGNGYSLAWAGDLDGDGKLDLLIAHTPEFPSYDLFLSSRPGGRLVRHVAGLRRMGD